MTATAAKDVTAPAVVLETSTRAVTPRPYEVLQPTWIRMSVYWVPFLALLGAARAFGPHATTELLVSVVVAGMACRLARRAAAIRDHQRWTRHLGGGVERVTIDAMGVTRGGERLAWAEVTDAAEIDTPSPGGDENVIAVRGRGPWCIVVPKAKFIRGTFEDARATVMRARRGNVRVVTT